MQQLGQALRQARESRGLTMEQAERDTRIRAKFLVAMENGDLSEIPSRVQARGFMYNYAQYLGLNAADIVARFDALQGLAAPQTNAPVQSPPAATPASPQYPPTGQPAPASQPPPYYRQPTPPSPVPSPIPRLTTPPQPIPTPLPGVPEQNDTTPAPPQTLFGRLLRSDLFLISVLALLTVLALGVGGTLLRNLPTREPGTTQSAFLESLNDGEAGTATPTFEPTSTPTSTIPPLPSDRVRVSFEVTQRNWLTIDVDGENVFAGLAEPGTILQYEGLQTIRVTTGNGAALDVTYQGVEVGPLGGRGQLVEEIYTPGGLRTLTPTPSPTLTNTPIPTATGQGGTGTPEPTGTPPPDSP